MIDKIKILYVINYITNGGPTRVLLNQMYGLDHNKFDIYLLTLIDSNDEMIEHELEKNNIHIVKIKMRKKIKDMFLFKNKIINEVRKISPNIIHTHGIVPSIILSSNRIKTIKVTTIHDNIYEDYKRTYGTVKGLLIAFIHLKRLKKFDYIFGCSRTSYNVIKNKFKNITYIRNGIDVLKPSPKNKKLIRKKIRQELGIDDNAIVYCYCGALNKLKRVKELVEKFNYTLNDNEYFIIAGDGKEFDNISSSIKNNHIIMVGFKKNIIDYYIASDIYTSNSSSEGFSISIIEALSCNLLLFLSNIPSHCECFEIDHTYYLGEIFSDDNFSEKKKRLSFNLKKTNTEKFYKKYLSSQSMVSEYVNYYERLLKNEKK